MYLLVKVSLAAYEESLILRDDAWDGCQDLLLLLVSARPGGDAKPESMDKAWGPNFLLDNLLDEVGEGEKVESRLVPLATIDCWFQFSVLNAAILLFGLPTPDVKIHPTQLLTDEVSYIIYLRATIRRVAMFLYVYCIGDSTGDKTQVFTGKLILKVPGVPMGI